MLGFSVLYLVDTLTLFATLWAVIRLPRLPIEGSTGRTPGLSAVLDGFSYLRGHPVLLMSFVVDIIAMVFGMPRALFPQVAHQSFGGPVDGGLAFALLYAGIPVGAVLGGVLSGWVSRVRGQGRAVVGAIAVWGLAMTGFGAAVGLAPQAQQAMLVASVLMLVVGGAADMASAAFRSSIGAADQLEQLGRRRLVERMGEGLQVGLRLHQRRHRVRRGHGVDQPRAGARTLRAPPCGRRRSFPRRRPRSPPARGRPCGRGPEPRQPLGRLRVGHQRRPGGIGRRDGRCPRRRRRPPRPARAGGPGGARRR